MLVDAISDSAPARNSFVPTLVRAWLLTADTWQRLETACLEGAISGVERGRLEWIDGL